MPPAPEKVVSTKKPQLHLTANVGGRTLTVSSQVRETEGMERRQDGRAGKSGGGTETEEVLYRYNRNMLVLVLLRFKVKINVKS